MPKLQAGAKVADIGCGVGFSTLLMAEAFPKSRFVGYDFHAPSIEQANAHAKAHGLADRVRFETAAAKDIAERDFDLVTMFDCLHDMGDPRGCAAHVRKLLKPDGAWMIVEPIAGDQPGDNVGNPVSRLYYNASTMICVPTSLAQEVGEALGAQAGEAKLTEVLKGAGFSRVRRADRRALQHGAGSATISERGPEQTSVPDPFARLTLDCHLQNIEHGFFLAMVQGGSQVDHRLHVMLCFAAGRSLPRHDLSLYLVC